ncbi:hypothetical protein HF846_04295 [Clostridium cadaveris]|uniref:Morphogenetic protein n=1 Tax=Clostridium cadaveris TaxID=1529 RepID=A0A316M141_9CLOT|nr:hypothetical protein [Clostridium cadaveris]NME63821.1 hypothetical protein [Clostridium cadaveris]PWL51811.1 MAG: hypothetical protein DBY38_12765 [Clostridium cadaveris]
MLKPILFNTDMVKAILEGRKTCTRRIIKNLIVFNQEEETFSHKDKKSDIGYKVGLTKDEIIEYAPYQVGDILWVRETWCDATTDLYVDSDLELGDCKYIFKVDDNGRIQPIIELDVKRWRPSIHMPKEAARIFLEVTSVRAERLKDIAEDGAKAEGAISTAIENEDGTDYVGLYAIENFREIWNSTIKKEERHKYGWNANPWVWVIEFKRVEME